MINASIIGNAWMFTGRMWDDVLGLYDYRARVYNPKLGVFYQTDPLGYADSTNMYAYCVNDPVNFVDPYGEQAEVVPFPTTVKPEPITTIPTGGITGGNDIGGTKIDDIIGGISTPIEEECNSILTGLFSEEVEAEKEEEVEAEEAQEEEEEVKDEKSDKPKIPLRS